MEVTRNLLRQRFTEYNQAYFDGKLTMPKFYFLCSKRPFGRSICSKRGLEIWMTKRIIWTDYHIDRNTMKRSIQIVIDNTKVRGNVTPINPETMMVKLREPEVYSCEAICRIESMRNTYMPVFPPSN